MTIKAGDKLPNAIFSYMGADGPQEMTVDELCKAKKVVLFALPGAFTPTCSAAHLPGFVASYDALKKKGADTIACLSVNDAFVMDAWGKAQNAGDILMLADGNGDFAKVIGLELDLTARRMGVRSQRYAMVIDDGAVSELYVEAPGQFDVSSAEHVLEGL